MKTNNWKTTIAPHIIAVAVFIALSYLFLMPLLQGKVLAQHDYTQAKGQHHELTEYADKTGDYALWTNGMFSGMPAIQLWLEYPMNLIGEGMALVSALFLNETSLLFYLMVGVYLVLFPLTRNVWLSAIGSIAFAFGSFNMVSIEAGHLNKVLSMAFMAPILGGIILAYRGKWMAGALLMGIFLALQLRSNHIQITYYTLIAGALLGAFYVVYGIVKKDLPNVAKATGLLVVATLLAVGSNAAQIWGTYDYSHATIRGGKSELTSGPEDTKQGSLTPEYAFAWSQGIDETMTLLIPNYKGGGSGGSYEGTEAYKKILPMAAQQLPKKEAEKVANQIVASEMYWGDQPFTSGPIYFGAIVCFLFVLGMFVIKHPVKWALFAIALITIMLSWGKNFEAFNNAVFNLVPMYNKFRTPSMILTVTNLIFVVIGFWALKEIWETKDKQQVLKHLKIAAGIVVGILVVFGLGAGIWFDFGTGKEKEYVDLATKLADRKSLLMMDALRSLFFVVAAAAIVWAWVTEKLKRQYLVIALGVLVLFDGWQVSKRYLNEQDFVSKSEYKNIFVPSQADMAILQDKDLSYRMLDLTGSPFNNAAPSYWHKSVGGYHAAKLRTYQELIENQIIKDMGTLGQGLNSKGTVPENIPVLNMLNTRYFVFGKEADKVVRNPYAAGNAWFAKTVLTVNSADEELFGLSNIDTRTTALVRNTFSDQLAGFNPLPDPAGSITLTDYKPDQLKYNFKSNNKELVVFSEIYYPDGTSWKAFIDGKSVPHLRANYVLRALVVPAGEHTIEFKFEPAYYKTGGIVSLISSLLLLIGLAAYIYWEAKGKAKTNAKANAPKLATK